MPGSVRRMFVAATELRRQAPRRLTANFSVPNLTPERDAERHRSRRNILD